MNFFEGLKRLSRKISLVFIIEYISLLRFFKHYSLGEYVRYNGYTCILHQGVSRPYWNIFETKHVPSPEFKHVHESEFQKIYTIQNFWNVYTWTRKFYYSNWYDIWVNTGLKKENAYILWQ